MNDQKQAQLDRLTDKYRAMQDNANLSDTVQDYIIGAILASMSIDDAIKYFTEWTTANGVLGLATEFDVALSNQWTREEVVEVFNDEVTPQDRDTLMATYDNDSTEIINVLIDYLVKCESYPSNYEDLHRCVFYCIYRMVN